MIIVTLSIYRAIIVWIYIYTYKKSDGVTA